MKVYLNMKNSRAEGIYDKNNGSIKVLPGAIFEKQVSEGFQTHNYLKLRKQLLNSGKVEEYISNEIIEFSSLSAAAAVIGGRPAAGPKEWKLEDGKTLKEYLEISERVDYFIDYFHKHKNRKIQQKSLDQAKYIRNSFPLERIRNMTLEEYDKKGSRSSLCYLIEYQTKDMSGGWFGSSQNKLFYHFNGQYLNSNFIDSKYPKLSIEDKFRLYKEDLYELITSFDKDNYVSSGYNILPTGANYIRSKLINIYHPNTILSLDSKTILMKIMDYLGEKINMYLDSVEINIALLKYTYKIIPESNEIDPWVISSIYWDFYLDVIDKMDEVEVDEAIDNQPNENDDLFIEDQLIDEIVTLMRKKKNIILQGAPGVGKTFSIKKIIKNNFEIFDAQEQILMLQFHQSFAYEEFIEGLRPTTHSAGFTVESGIFKKFIEETVKINPEKDYFLIIDEINRGNISKIFGELLMLIEADKRGEQYKVRLPYSNESFYVPKNLYIVGTMNTADRSLALIDYALRRRFSFIDLVPKYNSKKFNDFLKTIGINDEETSRINQTMARINQEINRDLGPNFEIGHSYFVDTKIEDFESWYNSIIKYDIIPLLKEYYFDDPEKVEKILIDLDLKYE
jgi:MoxR-like ATPase